MPRAFISNDDNNDHVRLTDAEWLNHDGTFRFGNHEGRSYTAVADDDVGYLRWALTQNMCDEDYNVIRAHLSRIGELND